MSFINPFLDKDEGKAERNSQKFSLMFIEQGFFHRMEIKTIDSLHKLKIRLKKPVILSIYTLDVVRHIINHSEVINSILQIDNLYQLKLTVPGYGIFSQNYQLQQISKLFSILGQYCLSAKVTLKKITIQMPGWHTFSIEIIQNFFRFISQCQILEEFSLNLNLAYKKPILVQQSEIPERQKEQLRFYGSRAFNLQSFEKLLSCLTTFLPSNFLTKLDLRFGSWESVSDDMLISFTEFIQQLYSTYHNLKVVKIDLHGWGVGEYDNEEDKISKEQVDNFFKAIQQIQSSTSQVLQLDMRFWPNKYGVKKQKQRFQYLNGLKRKQDGPNGNTQTPWNMTGTNFFGSQLRSKLLMKLKIQIKD